MSYKRKGVGIALLLAMMVLCSCNSNELTIAGRWEYVGYNANGVFNPEKNENLWIEFAADGNGTFYISGAETGITWDGNAEEILMTWQGSQFTLYPMFVDDAYWQVIVDILGNYFVFQKT